MGVPVLVAAAGPAGPPASAGAGPPNLVDSELSVICYRWKLFTGALGSAKQGLLPAVRLMLNPGSVKVPASVEYAISCRLVMLIEVAACEKLPLPARAGVLTGSALLSMPC